MKRALLGTVALLVLSAAAFGQAPKGLTSTKVGEKPTLDGKLDEKLWEVASTAEFKVAMVRMADLAAGNFAPAAARDAKLYVANDDDNLYIGLVLKGDDYDAEFDPNTGRVRVDMLVTQFDTDNNLAASVGDDQKLLISVNNGTFVDQYRVKLQGPDEHVDDPDRAGHTGPDGAGAMVHSTRAGIGDYTIEMSIPLSSGDKNDFSAKPGGQVNMTMIFADGFNMQNAMNDMLLGVVAGPTIESMFSGGSSYIPLTLAE